MIESLLTTKVSIPPTRVNLVHRARLIRQLNSGFQRKLTVVTAPAGFGKTTLLSDWVGQQEIPIAWLSLDSQENDPDRFLTYFSSALQSVNPQLRLVEHLALLRQARQSTPIDAIMTLLVNKLDELDGPVGLVLDDYQLISSQEVHDLISFLLEHLPQHVHIIIASRVDPSLPLARLRARDQLVEITEKDLRFTPEEVATFMREVMGVELSSVDITTLESRTEGWIAGIQLVALSLEGRPDISEFIASLSGTHRYILDYLADEVFTKLPEVLQVFLMWISPLTRFSGDLCDTVVGDLFHQDWGLEPQPWDEPSELNSKLILEFLDDSNLFVFPLDYERHWYRFHPLFSTFLENRLADRYRDEVPELHRRMSDWFSEHGFVAEAIRHSLSAQDIDTAADLIIGQIKPALTRGETSTVIRWIKALPTEVLTKKPALEIGLAWSLLLNNPVRFEREIHEHSTRLKESLEVDDGTILKRLRETEDGSHERVILSELAFLVALLSRDRGDLDWTIELFEAALAAFSVDDHFMQTFALGGLASTYARAGKLELAERTFARAAESGIQSGSAYAFIASKDWEATTQVLQGRLNQATATFRTAIDYLSKKGVEGLPLTGHAFVGLADILLEKNQLSEALEHVEEGIRRGALVNDIDALREGYLIKARILVAMGDETGYREAIEKGMEIAYEIPSLHCLQEAQAWEAILQIAQGEISSAVDWASNRGLIDQESVESAQEIERMALGRLLLAQRKISDAEAVFKSLLKWVEGAGLLRSKIQVLVLLSLVLKASGRREEALRNLAHALLLAEPEGYVRSFIDGGSVIAALMQSAAAEGHSPEYVQRLLKVFGQQVSPAAPLEPLTERELEVLRLMASGMTNAEIAEELVVAVSTVKTHINHIYSKLGVTRRTQAIAKARELRLLL